MSWSTECRRRWYLKPSWVEVGGGWGVRVFEDYESMRAFLEHQKELATAKGNAQTSKELQERLTRWGYLRYKVCVRHTL